MERDGGFFTDQSRWDVADLRSRLTRPSVEHVLLLKIEELNGEIYREKIALC